MRICPRCTMSMPFDAQVCTGCCLTFEAEAVAAPAAPIAAAFVPPGTPAPDNPWRQPGAEPELYPAPSYAEAPAYAEGPDRPHEEPAAPAAPVHVPVELATQAPPSGVPILMSDPLPPLPVAPPAEVTPIPMATDDPLIPVADGDGEPTARGLGLPPEATLAVPAAYAPFAPEPMTAEPAKAVAAADIVELIPAGGLTVAPPAVHLPGWPDAQSANG